MCGNHQVHRTPAANIAVGPSPWGPFASGVTADAVVTPEGGLGSWEPRPGQTVIVVGKDNHRHAWAREAIDALVDAVPPRGDAGPFRLPVQRVFSAAGHGTVATGVPVSGRVAPVSSSALPPRPSRP